MILGDGAAWIWKLTEEHFPGAIQVLDFHHAQMYLWNAANAVWGPVAPKPRSGPRLRSSST